MIRPIPIVILCVLALTACGWQPLYQSNQIDIKGKMASITIVKIDHRLEQLLRNALLSELTPQGEPAKPYYKLQLHLSETRANVGVRDSYATRADLTLKAQWTLTRIKDGIVIYRDSSSRTGSYDLISNDYANLVASESNRKKLVKHLSQSIRVGIATAFNRIAKVRAAHTKAKKGQ